MTRPKHTRPRSVATGRGGNDPECEERDFAQDGDQDLMELFSKIQQRHDKKNVSLQDRLEAQSSDTANRLREATKELIARQQTEINEKVAEHKKIMEKLEDERLETMEKIKQEVECYKTLKVQTSASLSNHGSALRNSHIAYVDELWKGTNDGIQHVRSIYDGDNEAEANVVVNEHMADSGQKASGTQNPKVTKAIERVLTELTQNNGVSKKRSPKSFGHCTREVLQSTPLKTLQRPPFEDSYRDSVSGRKSKLRSRK